MPPLQPGGALGLAVCTAARVGCRGGALNVGIAGALLGTGSETSASKSPVEVLVAAGVVGCDMVMAGRGGGASDGVALGACSDGRGDMAGEGTSAGVLAALAGFSMLSSSEGMSMFVLVPSNSSVSSDDGAAACVWPTSVSKSTSVFAPMRDERLGRDAALFCSLTISLVCSSTLCVSFR